MASRIDEITDKMSELISKQKQRPQYIVAWRTKNGRNQWEAVSSQQFGPFCYYLENVKKIPKASIHFHHLTIAHWLHPELHKGCRQVWVREIYEEIFGDKEGTYTPPNIEPIKEEKDTSPNYGYVSPEGEYYKCAYGGHRSLEDELVGLMNKYDNAQRILFDKGWLCIYHDPFAHGSYAIAMGHRKEMSNKQLKTLERLGIPSTCRGFAEHLGGVY